MRILKPIAVMLLTTGLVLAYPVHAKDKAESPQVLVETVTGKVLAALKEFKAKGGVDNEFLDNKIEELILSQMDFADMSRLVLGKHWRAATEDQRTRFVEQFRTLLVRTYKTSLVEYTDEKINFLPFRESEDPNKLATVRSEIIRSNGPSIPINYSLRFKEADGWKVFDIGIEGISLVTNYRSSFSREITQSGIDHLIDSLRKRNAGHAPDAG
jgi:phospholipid transport system substrate-binding protein